MDRFRNDPRVTARNGLEFGGGGACVLYVMQRSQRASDNRALDLAVETGNSLGLPVAVLVFIMRYPHANARHYSFFLDGLPDVRDGLRRRNVSFHLRFADKGSFARDIVSFSPAVVIGDENPLRETEAQRRKLAEELKVPYITVDSDVVVPSSLFEKELYSAKVMRTRMRDLLPRFLAPSPEPKAHHSPLAAAEDAFIPALPDVAERLGIDLSVGTVSTRGGRKAGNRALKRFIGKGLRGYDTGRNDPNMDATSRLSPYLHFGHLGPVGTALEVMSSGAPENDKEAFLEQLIVRRELAVNFVRHNPRYDSFGSVEKWARETLARHRADFERRYGPGDLEGAATDDPLWNAAQKQMTSTGFMHNYLRMYWAKRMLFWCGSPEEAHETAVRLNDKYELDGRDPNGYAGIAWAVGGKHDRPFPPDKPVMGLIRPMTLSGAKRKFDVEKLVRTLTGR